jgi:hypothetical protein
MRILLVNVTSNMLKEYITNLVQSSKFSIDDSKNKTNNFLERQLMIYTQATMLDSFLLLFESNSQIVN